MNIFVLSTDPTEAAQMHCDKHLPKMVVEHLQQCGSAVIRHGATPDIMPLTKKGTPLKGGYHHHPCTVWCGDTRQNYLYAVNMGIALAKEYTFRFGKTHFCEAGLQHLLSLAHLIPDGSLTAHAQAMPDKYRNNNTVKAYRDYYHSKLFAKWERGRSAPAWWQGC